MLTNDIISFEQMDPDCVYAKCLAHVQTAQGLCICQVTVYHKNLCCDGNNFWLYINSRFLISDCIKMTNVL